MTDDDRDDQDDAGAAELERFDPLLRDLITWRLVEKESGSEGAAWRLTDPVRRRLEQLSPRPIAAEKLLYFDHRCVRCGRRRVTRLRGGHYVCDACSESEAAP